MPVDLDLRFSPSALSRTEGPAKLENSHGAHESGGLRAVHFRVSEELVPGENEGPLRREEDLGSRVGMGRKILTTGDTEEHRENYGLTASNDCA